MITDDQRGIPVPFVGILALARPGLAGEDVRNVLAVGLDVGQLLKARPSLNLDEQLAGRGDRDLGQIRPRRGQAHRACR